MKKIISPYPKEFENPSSENSESTISNAPISENSDKEPELYTIDDLIDVWVRGCTNGATLWAYCQEHNKSLPSSFEYGLQLLSEEIRKQPHKDVALKEVTGSNMILVGLFDELIDNK